MKHSRYPVRPLGALVFIALPLIVLVAAPTTPTTDSPPATAAYTNQPQSVPYDPPTVPHQPYYERSGSFPSSFQNDFRYSAPIWRSVFFFPPVPPQLGGPLVLFRNYQLGQPESVLPQLKSHVGEPFYAPLSAHLHREDLSKNVSNVSTPTPRPAPPSSPSFVRNLSPPATPIRAPDARR